MMVASNATRVAVNVDKDSSAVLAAWIKVTGVNAAMIVRPLGLTQDAPDKSAACR